MTNSPRTVEDCAIPASINLYYDLYIPGDGPRPLLIAIHGYGANKRQMMREARLMAPPEFAIATLQGPHQHIREPKEKGGPLRFGFGWLTNFRPEESVQVHHEAVAKMIESLVAGKTVDQSRIFLLGFSQSCALNFRFAFAHGELLRGVVGICGGIPGDWDTNESYTRSDASIFYLHGDADEFYDPSRVAEFGPRLRERADDVEVKSYAAGHEIVAEMRDDVRAWLARRA